MNVTGVEQIASITVVETGGVWREAASVTISGQGPTARQVSLLSTPIELDCVVLIKLPPCCRHLSSVVQRTWGLWWGEMSL